MSRRTRRAAGIGAVAALVVGTYGALDVIDVAPGFLTRETRAEAPAQSPGAVNAGDAGDAGEAADLAPPPAPLPTLADSARVPTTAGLRTALAAPLSAAVLGQSVGIDVRDGLTGRRLFGSGQDVPRTPASTAKVLTAAAVTHATRRDAVFTTRTVVGASPSDVVLVAGGDTLLARGKGDPAAVAGHAGLADLARATAASLKKSGVTRVRVLLDDAHAKGPALAPGWAPGDVALGLTGPVTMLGTTDARALPGRPAPADPPLAATSVFASALVAEGIQVRGRPARTGPVDGGTVLAEVTSARRDEVLALALDESDNALTETLARAAASDAGVSDLTFESVAAWIEEQVAAQDIATDRIDLHDASGLSRTTRVPASTVAAVITHASTGRSPGLADVVARLPVAALSGTLADRFADPASRAGVGVARAKTGTLTGVNALAGTVTDADGRLLVYAILADRTGGTLEARAALDQVVATLARCGCRSPK